MNTIRTLVATLFVCSMLLACSETSGEKHGENGKGFSQKKEALPQTEFMHRIDELESFFRLASEVRFFHPSDGVADTDWEQFLAYGAYRVAQTENSADYINVLRELFHPLAPTLEIEGSAKNALNTESDDYVFVWIQNGFKDVYGSTSRYFERKRSSKTYRNFKRDIKAPQQDVYSNTLANLSYSLPLIQVVKDGTSFPASHAFIGHDKYILPGSYTSNWACLTVAGQKWAYVQHYFPYFDDININWDSQLRPLLSSCENGDREELTKAILKAYTLLDDNHVAVNGPNFPVGQSVPELLIDWIEDKLLVVKGSDANPNISVGDEVTMIDGIDVNNLHKQYEAISGQSKHTQKTWIANMYLLARNMSETIELLLMRPDGSQYSETITANLPRNTMFNDRYVLAFKTNDLHRELDAGIHYIRAYGIKSEEVAGIVEKVKNAKGLIIDMRLYPEENGNWGNLFGHFSQTPLHSLPFFRHYQRAPNQSDPYRENISSTVVLKSPYLAMPKIALQSRYSISQNEHALGHLQSIGIPILGEPTMGANGTLNRFYSLSRDLSRGYAVSFTAQEIRQHDGSQHIGVGLIPDIHVAPSREGVIAGIDEQLIAAEEWLKQQH